MKKLLILLFILPSLCFAQYNLMQDTTISTTWYLNSNILKVSPGVKIHGTGTISGGYIDASYYQNIFDTSLNIQIKGGAYNTVSTSWFGTSPNNADNSPYFQKAINATINKNVTLYTPAGVYNDSSSIEISDKYQGDWGPVSLTWKGDYVYNGAVQGTLINFLAKGGFCLGIQKAKGVVIDGIALGGQFKNINKPAAVGINYYNIAYDDFKDTTCSDYYSGVIVDPYANNGNVEGGSTGITFRNMLVGNFTTLFKMSPTVYTLNAEEIIADRVVFGMAQTGWRSQQGQEKQNVIRNSMAWSQMHTLFYADYGNLTGNYHIHDINVAGMVIRLFYIWQAGGFSTKIDNIYAERIGSIGFLSTTAMVISVRDCIFSFVLKDEAGTQYLATTNSLNVQFTNCDFTYYGFSYSMTFSGIASYIGCYFSGPFTNSAQGSVFSSSCQFKN